jgi:hypothetical protein
LIHVHDSQADKTLSAGRGWRAKENCRVPPVRRPDNAVHQDLRGHDNQLDRSCIQLFATVRASVDDEESRAHGCPGGQVAKLSAYENMSAVG